MRTAAPVLLAIGLAGAALLPVPAHAAQKEALGGLSATPAGLRVDVAGNGVLEPGEAVTVMPRWLNDGLLDLINVAGTALSFDGPAGPTYSMPDPVGVYGLIVAGDGEWCVDCYTLEVQAAVRPSLHWDAVARELLVPTLSTKDWVVHVGASFDDVPSGNAYYPFVETILHANVTSGCANSAYCPSSSTTREQMAVFALVSKEGSGYTPAACTTPLFSDVPADSPYCRWIEELARRGVVAGCGGGQFCPGAAVSREQMAVFVLRTLDTSIDPPACGASTLYSDVAAGSPYCRWIEELTRRQVVTGCGDGKYCPAQAVTREQMAVFLAVTFSLSLYGA
jgi:hypothetical protein